MGETTWEKPPGELLPHSSNMSASDWQEYVCDSDHEFAGEVYYVNMTIGKTTWGIPQEEKPVASAYSSTSPHTSYFASSSTNPCHAEIAITSTTLCGTKATRGLSVPQALREVWQSSYGRRTERLYAIEQDEKMPFWLTLPEAHVAGRTEHKKYPLFVHLHSGGGFAAKGICTSLDFVKQDSLLMPLVTSPRRGCWDQFIGVAPCCPRLSGMLKKGELVYWFKILTSADYENWRLSAMKQCQEVEKMFIALLFNICSNLPVDAHRIYFVGASAGGYATLRLGELLCHLPAAIVPIAGYYPDAPEHGHCLRTLIERLRQVVVWPLHCDKDQICKVDSPHVHRLYDALRDIGVQVDWVDASLAKGSCKNFHSSHKIVERYPEAFFEKLLTYQRSTTVDPVAYLQQRLRELQSDC